MSICVLLQSKVSHFLFKGKLTDDICKDRCVRMKPFWNTLTTRLHVYGACLSIF